MINAVPPAGQLGAAAIHVARSLKSLAVYLPLNTAISATLLIALPMMVGLLAPFRILFAPLEGSALWHEFDAQLKPLTGAAYSAWPLTQLPVARAGIAGVRVRIASSMLRTFTDGVMAVSGGLRIRFAGGGMRQAHFRWPTSTSS